MYIKVSDNNKCYRSEFNWADWFYNLNAMEAHKDDIICDRTSVIEKLIGCFNEQIKSLRITRMLLEKWWYGSQIVDEYLKGIFGSNEKYEFTKKMRDQFQKAVCRHPLEWDKTLFNCKKIEDSYFDITHTHLREHIKTKLIKESEQSDIWEGALQNVFKKNDFYFVNPLYFAHHLDRAGVFGFNPYEGREPVTIMKSDFMLQTRTQEFKSNPGFAPYNTDLSVDGYEYQGVKYAKITCHFDIRRGESGKRHTGVDLASWKKSVPIKSFISGEVLGYFWNGSRKDRVLDGTGGYGNLMLIKGDNDYLYLLGHLASCLIPYGRIYPGQDVAMSGQTGYSTGYHLHLEIFKLPEALKDKKETAFFAKIGGSDNYQSVHDKIKAERCNPFDHNDKFNTYEE